MSQYDTIQNTCPLRQIESVPHQKFQMRTNTTQTQRECHTYKYVMNPFLLCHTFLTVYHCLIHFANITAVHCMSEVLHKVMCVQNFLSKRVCNSQNILTSHLFTHTHSQVNCFSIDCFAKRKLKAHINTKRSIRGVRTFTRNKLQIILICVNSINIKEIRSQFANIKEFHSEFSWNVIIATLLLGINRNEFSSLLF